VHLVLRVVVDHIAPGEMTLKGDAAHYVARIHRICRGERILLFDPSHAIEAVARVTHVGPGAVACEVGSARVCTTVASRPITLIQSIAKGLKLDAIVRDATELGATRIVIARAARSVVKLDEKARSRRERWRRIAQQAARQCGRGDAPAVDGPLPWREAVGADAGTGALKICLWEEAVDPIGPLIAGLLPGQPVAFAVGPEGGLEASEVEIARAAGFVSVTIGPFVLRTETVAPSMLGALLVLGL
jgi:16S rRNA (uracil1498-N3)-methyltransferase